MLRKRLIFYLLLFIIISLCIYLLGLRIKPEEIKPWIEKTGFWAPIIYIFLTSLTFIIAPLSGTPIFLAGYLLFRSRVQIYSYFAAFLSAAVNFWIARIWGRGWVVKMVGKKNMEKVDQFTQNYGIKSLIFLRVLQGHLHDFISYAYGLTDMKFLPYMVVTILTPIPWILLWQLFLFKRIRNIGEFTIWWGATLVPLFIISGFFVSKYRKRS